MTKGQKKYLEEYEKYKHIKITPGKYQIKNNFREVEIISVDEYTEKAVVKNHTGFEKERTLHWCRKNLDRKED